MTLNERIAYLRQSDDKAEMDKFIGEYRPLILSVVSKITGRFTDTENDEEFSVAMFAFYEAIKSYDADKGDFIGFAKTVMTRRVIDFLKKENKFQKLHIMTDFHDEPDEEADSYMAEASVDAFNMSSDNDMLRIEIARLKEELGVWGLTFKDLLKQSPKHTSTRILYRDIVSKIIRSPEIMDIIINKRYIPVKKICEELKITPKKLSMFEHI